MILEVQKVFSQSQTWISDLDQWDRKKWNLYLFEKHRDNGNIFLESANVFQLNMIVGVVNTSLHKMFHCFRFGCTHLEDRDVWRLSIKAASLADSGSLSIHHWSNVRLTHWPKLLVKEIDRDFIWEIGVKIPYQKNPFGKMHLSDFTLCGQC